MNFSRDSWHFKLNYKFYDSWYGRDTSLCSYFWRTVWAMAVSLSVIVFCILVTLGAIIALAYPVTQFWNGSSGGMALVSGLSWCFVAFVLRMETEDRLSNKHWLHKPVYTSKSRLKPQPRLKPREPSLLGEWLKARKAKVCPIITFKESYED